jgi:hypothetical protein
MEAVSKTTLVAVPEEMSCAVKVRFATAPAVTKGIDH